MWGEKEHLYKSSTNRDYLDSAAIQFLNCVFS